MSKALTHSFTNGYTSLILFPLQTFAKALFIPITPLVCSKPFWFLLLLSFLWKLLLTACWFCLLTFSISHLAFFFLPLFLFQGFRFPSSPLWSYFGYFSSQQLRTHGRANERSNKEKQTWLQNIFGLGREFSKLLNYLDKEFISKSYFTLLPDTHLHLRAVSVLRTSSDAASLFTSCFKQREEPLPFSYSMWLQVKNAVGHRRASWGQWGPASAPNQ